MNYTIEEIYQNIEVNERRFIIHADTGFSLPATIMATNCTYTYDSETGEVVITETTGDVVITANMVADTFNIAYNLTNVSGVGTLPTTAIYGSVTTITFEADSGYRMPTNVNVSGCSYSWQQSSGQYWELVLSEFTGNVTITIEGIRCYTITKTAVNATIQGADTIDEGAYSYYNITSNYGYYLPDTMIVNGYTVGNTTVDLGNSKARYEKQDDDWAILYLSDVYEDITCSIGGLAYYTLTTTLTGATLTSVQIGGETATSPYKIKHGQGVLVTMTADQYYDWTGSNYSATMGGSSAGIFTVNNSVLQCYISSAEGNIVVTATATSPSYTLGITLSNITVGTIVLNGNTVSTLPQSVSYGDHLVFSITNPIGYTLPTTITVNSIILSPSGSSQVCGNCSAQYVRNDDTTGAINLFYFTGNTTVSASGTANIYSITKSITNGTASGASTITYGSTATVTITADSGYDLPSTVSVSGANYSYNDTTGVITLTNPTGNVTITATCPQSQPVDYVIPAGLYYGKDNFSIVSQQTSISASGSCDKQLFDTITIDTYELTPEPIPGELVPIGALVPIIEYRFSDLVPGIAYFDDWIDGYRAITINSYTTVTQAQYEAFFDCYDQVFAFTVQRVGSSSTTYYSPVGYTWQQFVADSTYNPNGDFTIGDNVVMYTSFPIHWKNTLTPASTIHATDLVSNHSAYYFSIGGGGDN